MLLLSGPLQPIGIGFLSFLSVSGVSHSLCQSQDLSVSPGSAMDYTTSSLSSPRTGFSMDISAPYQCPMGGDWSILVFIPAVNVSQSGLSKTRAWMACLIPNPLRICCIPFTDSQCPKCSGRYPSLGQASLQAKIIPSIRKWVLWIPQVPCRHRWWVGYVVMLLIFSVSCLVTKMSLPSVPHSHTNHAWLHSLAF